MEKASVHFMPALKHVLGEEGGKSNHAADKGGATKWGISLRFLKGLPDLAGDLDGDGHVSAADIDALTRDTMVQFYRVHFWEHYRLQYIADRRVATKLFSFFVNMRGKTAALVAQRAANMLDADLLEDGVLGPKSRAAINRLNGEHLVPCIMVQAWYVYRAIGANNSGQMVFLPGWRNRAFAPVSG